MKETVPVAPSADRDAWMRATMPVASLADRG